VAGSGKIRIGQWIDATKLRGAVRAGRGGKGHAALQDAGKARQWHGHDCSPPAWPAVHSGGVAPPVFLQPKFSQ
jgi:hypothetical protein